MEVVTRLLLLIPLMGIVSGTRTCGQCLGPPDFISNPIILSAQSTSDSEKTVEHGLPDLPIKVDVKVFPASGPEDNFAFPGLGFTFRDDDENSPYGGVLFKYNESHVMLQAPNRFDGFSSGKCIYTGESAWRGPVKQSETVARVIVRAWTRCSFKTPEFESPWKLIIAQNVSGSIEDIPHGLNLLDLGSTYVSVQVNLGNTSWYTEATAGSSMLYKPTKDTQFGGVIYGFDTNIIRVMVPGLDDVGYVYSSADGWGHNSNETFTFGYFKVRVWTQFFGQTSTFQQTYRKTSNGAMEFSFGQRVNILNSIVAITAHDPMKGFYYPAMGAVQNAGADKTFQYGGVVYSYSDNSYRLWYPNFAKGKSAFLYVDNYWGDISTRPEHMVINPAMVDIHILVITATIGDCPLPTTKAVTTLSPMSTMVTTTTTTTTTTSTTSSTTSSTTTSTTTKSATTASPTTLKSITTMVKSVSKSTTVTAQPTTTAQTLKKLTTTLLKTTKLITKTTPSTTTDSTTPLMTTSTTVSTTNIFEGGFTTTTTMTTTATHSTSKKVFSHITRRNIVTAKPVHSHIHLNTQQNHGTKQSTESSEDPGFPGIAIGLIAAGAALAVAGCCGGLLFFYLRKYRDNDKKKRKICPEKNDVQDEKCPQDKDLESEKKKSEAGGLESLERPLSHGHKDDHQPQPPLNTADVST